MRRVSKLFLPVLVCALAVLNGQAQTARSVRVDFKETTLKNGLRVITVEDHYAGGGIGDAVAPAIASAFLMEPKS